MRIAGQTMNSTYPRDYEFSFNANMGKIDSLVQSNSGTDFSFYDASDDDQAGSDYRWHSPHLQGICDRRELMEKASYLIALVNGAQKLTGCRVSSGELEVTSPVGHHFLTDSSDEFSYKLPPFSDKMDKWKYTMGDDPFRDWISYSLFLSRYEETSRHMLLFLGVNGPSWISLYALLDFINQYLRNNNLPNGERELAAKYNVEHGELRRFKYTANNFAAIGPFCRHGDQGHEPPNEPMLFGEAKDLIFELMRNFLKSHMDAMKIQFENLLKN